MRKHLCQVNFLSLDTDIIVFMEVFINYQELAQFSEYQSPEDLMFKSFF